MSVGSDEIRFEDKNNCTSEIRSHTGSTDTILHIEFGSPQRADKEGGVDYISAHVCRHLAAPPKMALTDFPTDRASPGFEEFQGWPATRQSGWPQQRQKGGVGDRNVARPTLSDKKNKHQQEPPKHTWLPVRSRVVRARGSRSSGGIAVNAWDCKASDR